MARYVLAVDAAVELTARRAVISDEQQLLAPSLLRSQLLSESFLAVREGRISKREAEQRLDHFRALKLRLLGDRVLQAWAWRVADQLNWPGTLEAEFVALTQLHGDALVTADPVFAAAGGLVRIAPVEEVVGRS